MTGFQGRDPLSVNFLISEYECLTRGRVTAGPLECYKSTLLLWFWSISWFSRIFKDPPLSKIRKIQAMDEITIVNNIFVENRKFPESQEEITSKRRKAAVDCFDCCERMRRMPQLVKYASVTTYQPRHTLRPTSGLVTQPWPSTAIEACLCAMFLFRTCGKRFFPVFEAFHVKINCRVLF